MIQVERAARLLSTCSERALTVSEATTEMEGNHVKMIELIRELEARGLLLRLSRKQRLGRPQHLLRTTPLGKQFLSEYKQLLGLRLHSNQNDIRKAIHQADLAKRLAEQGLSAYARFQEINELARNIANTAQVNRNPR